MIRSSQPAVMRLGILLVRALCCLLVLRTAEPRALARSPGPLDFPDPPAIESPRDLLPTAEQRERLGKSFKAFDHNTLYPGLFPESPKHARAMVELLLFLVFQTSIYYMISPTQETDWDTEFDESYMAKRLITLEHVRFDNNAFWYNNLSHPLLGSLSYQMGRSNDLGPGPSLALTALGAAGWEYFCELKEKVSINDVVTTSIGGMALGETVAQLGAFFDRASGSPLYRGLAILLGPLRAIHDRLDGAAPRRALLVDSLGMPADVAHDFRFRLGWTATRTSATGRDSGSWRNDAFLDLDLRLLNVLGAGREGTFWDQLAQGNVSRLAVSVSAGGDGLRQATFLSRAGIMGGYMQGLSRDAAGRMNGWSLYLGGATSFDVAAGDGFGLYGGRMDLWSNAGFLGLLLDVDGWMEGWHLSATVEFYPDFSLVRSQALHAWRQGRSIDGFPSILQREGYYYALGLTGLADLRAAYEGLELAFDLRYDDAWSLNGADRFQDRVTDDVHCTDRRLQTGLRLSYRFPRTHARLGGSFRWRSQTGRLHDTTVTRDDLTFGGDLALDF
mgnify:CR=1 FL=1